MTGLQKLTRRLSTLKKRKNLNGSMTPLVGTSRQGSLDSLCEIDSLASDAMEEEKSPEKSIFHLQMQKM